MESRLGHYYQADDTYLVGREKVREYARAVDLLVPVISGGAARVPSQ